MSYLVIGALGSVCCSVSCTSMMRLSQSTTSNGALLEVWRLWGSLDYCQLTVPETSFRSAQIFMSDCKIQGEKAILRQKCITIKKITQRATVMEAKPMLSYYEATVLVRNIDSYLIPVCFLLGPWHKYMQLHQQKTFINL